LWTLTVRQGEYLKSPIQTGTVPTAGD
jgi:hypothetical protein